MERRFFMAALAAACVLPGGARATSEPGPSISVTIDDFNSADGPVMDGPGKHAAILATLAKWGVQAAGFPAGKNVDDEAGRLRLRSWSDAGHAIGNHSYDHVYHGGGSPVPLGPDIDRLAPLIAPYAGFRPLFRFPFLAEGRTAATRDAMRADLAHRGLRNAHVTIDTSDWAITGRLVERLTREPGADIEPYRAFYVRHLLDRATFYDGLARDVLGYSPPHTILLHHNLTTALFLDSALEAFRARGWRIIAADEAFAHPIFSSLPDIAPAGNSLIWQLAKADGRFENRLRSPGEDGEYEKPGMDALGL